MTFKDELMEILKEEFKELKNIKELTFKKTDVIVKGEVEVLQNITKEEESSINKMAALEKKRLDLLNSWGVDKSTPLSKIIDKVPEGREELMDLKEKLNDILFSIQSRNDTNNKLIKENLDWIELNLNLIAQVETSTTYSNKMNDDKKGKSIFDRKV